LTGDLGSHEDTTALTGDPSRFARIERYRPSPLKGRRACVPGET
jgi:hypothetical protein